MRAVTLVPFRAADDRRRLLWDWVRPFLEEIGWPVYVGDNDGDFSRAPAMNAAAREAGEWDAALLADADSCLPLGAALLAARRAVEAGGAVRPWSHRIKLNREGTLKFAQYGPEIICECDVDRRDRTGSHAGGGALVVSRAAWEQVGGMDEQFIGYGNEDLALVAALQTLVLNGPMPWVPGTILHLWHQPAKNVGTRIAATPHNQARWELYRQARKDPGAMKALVPSRGRVSA